MPIRRAGSHDKDLIAGAGKALASVEQNQAVVRGGGRDKPAAGNRGNRPEWARPGETGRNARPRDNRPGRAGAAPRRWSTGGHAPDSRTPHKPGTAR
nr:hypothetical protein GCM10020063_032880 [Dactylosporangium thailandense]